MKKNIPWAKYAFLLFSGVSIVYGIYTLLDSTNIKYFQRWPDKISLYLVFPIAVITTLYYLRLFFTKHENASPKVSIFLIFIALCSVLSWTGSTVETFGAYYALGNSFAHMHWLSGLYFHIFLPLAGLIGLLIRRKIGWILALLYPCYMIYDFIEFIHLWFPIHYFDQALTLYPFLVYCVIFPVICCLPVMRNYFRIRSVKELLICLVIAAIIGISLIMHVDYRRAHAMPPGYNIENERTK